MKFLAKFVPAACLVGLLLCGCDVGPGAVETTEAAKIESISMVVDEQSILELEKNYPDLKQANLTGSECYQAIAAYADGSRIKYLDVNPLFDDGQGNLGTEYTSDGTHVLAKYYRTWAQWIAAQPV